MKYIVEYTPPAEEELIDLWTHSSDKPLVTSVVNRLERILGTDPRSIGESRQSPLTRAIFSPPIGMWVEIIEDDLKVLILHIWEMK